VRKSKLSKQKKSVDRGLLTLVLIFIFVGLVAVADASAPQALSAYGDKFFLFRQQAIWAVIGIGAFFVASKIHYSFWEKLAIPFFLASCVLLIVVLLPNLGFKAFGARRWIPLGFFSLQPSELIKLSLAMYLAKVASKSKGALSYFVPLGITCGLIMLQPDLGTTLVLATMAFSQIFVSGVNLLYFAGAVIAGVISTLGLIITSPYRKDRLLTFFESTSDPLGKSYHIRQILLGLGSGGILGVGLGASRQKYLFLPESATDSIFAVIAEELGAIGAFVIIGLFAFFIYKGLQIAASAPDRFSQVLAVGITAWIGGQAFLNIASMIALVPLTGIPLPFISYGGSSLVMALMACGILLNISAHAMHVNKYGHAQK
jgi:cell division protein FtsW